MTVNRLRTTLVAVCVTLAAALSASAQVFGTFSWQMQPYCNIVTMTITQIPGGYTIDGNDNQCGVGGRLAGAAGMALLNPDGTVGLEFTIVTAPSGKAVHVSASVSPANGSGPWADSVGNTGNFALGSPGSGSPRPLPASGVAPATITNVEIANNSITGANVVNGSLTTTDVLDAPRGAFANNVMAFTALTATATVVKSITLTAPAAGKVIVTGAGFFQFGDPAVSENGRCYLETGTTPGVQLVNAEEPSGAPNTMKNVPFGVTKGFTVAAGTVTVNMLCDAFFAPSGNVRLFNPTLTALFMAQ